MKLNFCLFFYILFSTICIHPAKSSDVLRMMTYNVHHCEGMDEEIDFQRIANIMLQDQPDVIAVQELDSSTSRSLNVYQLQKLAEITQMHGTFGPAIDYGGGKYGVGILSKQEPLSVKKISLPGDEEKRILLITEFDTFIFACTHFSLTENSRSESVKIILKEFSRAKKPVFLAGDLNAGWDSSEIRMLCEKFQILNNTDEWTIPSDQPEECIDFILGYTGDDINYSVLQSKVPDEPVASDHLPVFIEVKIE